MTNMSRRTLLLLQFFVVISLIHNSHTQIVSEQVHVSLGAQSSSLWVTWMTFGNETPPTPFVRFSLEKFTHNKFNGSVRESSGTSEPYMNGNRSSWVHRVELENLAEDSEYYYRVGFLDNWSSLLHLKTPPSEFEEWFPKLGIYGDLGLSNGISIPFLRANAHRYDAILHVGDIAYDLHDNNGENGDAFFRMMEPVMSSIPYQVVAGNHESWMNFSQYNARFTMVDQKSGEQNNHFYSFNFGPMHIVGFNSEFYYWYYDQPTRNLQQTRIQWEWLEKDLAAASRPENRRKHPWIVVMGHRPMYCSTADSDDCIFNECVLRKGIPIVNRYGLEDLFYKYGVDIILAGHEHTYERLFPVYDRQVYNGSSTLNPYENPRAPVHLLVGSAGCPEHVDPFVHRPKPWSAKRITDYGITELTFENRTHIHVEQRSTSKSGKVVDRFTIVKHDYALN